MRRARGAFWPFFSGGSTGSSSSSSSSNPREARRSLSLLEAMLKDERNWLDRVEAETDIDAQTKFRMKEIKDWIYDAEDVIDDWKFEAEADPFFDLLADPSFRSKVEEVKQKGVDIRQNGDALHLGDALGRKRHRVGTNMEPLPTSSLLGEEKIYGREDDQEMLFKFLFMLAEESSEDNLTGRPLNVVPIVGAAGVGKTTLVRRIYKDARDSKHFNLSGWVSSSKGLQMAELMRATGEALTGGPCHYNNLDGLQDLLRRIVDGRRLLLVLDDVWYETIDGDQWNKLRATFNCCAKGSVIILTTQDERVADTTRTVPSYILESLSGDHCWSIFEKHAFSRLPKHSPLVEIGKKIVEECQGSPLVAKALGLTLCHERDAEKWGEFLKIGMWDEVAPELQLSFHRLPAHLKRCFVFCSMFPKGHLLRREELVRLWMAQGFIQENRGRSLEDVGVAYFDDLALRSLFVKPQGTHEAFMLPNLLHALAQFISDGECLTIDCNNVKGNVPERLRHLSLTPSNSEFIMSLYFPTQLRSFVVVQSPPLENVTQALLDKELHNLNYLRALDVSGTNIVALPNSIGSLRHLLYLNLSHTKIERLPESVCKLYKLQTLDLGHTEIKGPQTLDLKDNDKANDGLPDALGNLSNLRYLVLEVTRIRRLPESIGKLSKLRTLHLSFTDIEELPKTIGSLKNLEILCLNNSKIQRLPESIHGLSNLQRLDLQHCASLKGLPRSIQELTRLQYLTLTFSLHVYMPTGISKLSKLKTLPKFNLTETDGSCRIVELKPLVHLEQLGISGLCNVVNLKDVEAADLKSKETLSDITLMWLCSEADEFIEHLNGSQNYDTEDENSISLAIDKDLEEHEHGDVCVSKQVASDIPDSNIKYINDNNTQESSGKDADKEEGVLQGLQPHTNLTKLHIRFYSGAEFPKWMGDPSFSSLTHVLLKNCMKCKALPQLGQLPHLMELDIDGMLMKKVTEDFCGNGSGKCFPSLKKLSFGNMSKWEEWNGVGKDDFPRLQELILFNCPKLMGVPRLCSPLTILKVERCGVRHIPTTKSLQDLELFSCDNLVSLSEESELTSLNSLRKLTLMYCQALEYLPSVPYLENLWIEEWILSQMDSSIRQKEYQSCKGTTINKLILKDDIKRQVHGLLLFDVAEAFGQPPIETTWQQASLVILSLI
ncbi:hypothetical protein Taro_039939 [Colocasia esculenta]|uniref:AAA+ ATPase domain-containing protein n=1 Tax=Colocasia esculenta TaxID=4460 RepID=A0A843WBV9_COLES|nr:hypothetical protein [Colocasia esculenta]